MEDKIVNVKDYKKKATGEQLPSIEATVRNPARVSSPQKTDWDDQVSGVCDDHNITSKFDDLEANYYGDCDHAKKPK